MLPKPQDVLFVDRGSQRPLLFNLAMQSWQLAKAVSPSPDCFRMLHLAVHHLEAAGLELPLPAYLFVFVFVIAGAHPFHLLRRGAQFEIGMARGLGGTLELDDDIVDEGPGADAIGFARVERTQRRLSFDLVRRADAAGGEQTVLGEETQNALKILRPHVMAITRRQVLDRLAIEHLVELLVPALG